MKELRKNKILDRISEINVEHPGIIAYTLNVATIPSTLDAVHVCRRTKLLKEVDELLKIYFQISSDSEFSIKSELLSYFPLETLDRNNYVSTLEYGKMIGIEDESMIIESLINDELIYQKGKDYYLTHKGENYGIYQNGQSQNDILWKKYALHHLLEPMVDDVIEKLDFELYHLTHIDNLKSIASGGIFCRNQVKEFNEISNLEVNQRRTKRDIHFEHSLHDYVPLYFNPKNAMLYQKQRELHDDIVILGIDKWIIKKDYTIFYEGNAARNDSRSTTCKIKLNSFSWNDIYAKRWLEDGCKNEYLKSMMMSECLIYHHIPRSFIKNLYVKTDANINKILSFNDKDKKNDERSVKKNKSISIVIQPNIYF